MTTSSDSELLRRWLDGHSEAAFEELVGRYAGMVRMAATRAGCDAATAGEATQMTFIALARKARSLAGRQSLGGWLYLTAMLQAKNALSLQRHEAKKREQFRSHMETPEEPATGTWQQMQPTLNEAMKSLSAPDREMILLRFYRSLSMSEIGGLLGIATEAAQKRVNRATERLRKQFERRGWKTSDAAFSPALMAGLGAEAKLGGLAVSTMSAKALAEAATAGGIAVWPALALMVSTKKSTIVAVALLLLAGAAGLAFVGQKSEFNNRSSQAKASPGKSATSPFTPQGGQAEAEVPGNEETDARTASLVKNYGEDRTKQSRRIALDMVSFAVDMKAVSSAGEPQLQWLKMMLGDTYGELQPSAEQEAAMLTVYRDAMRERSERTNREFEQLAKTPASLMELILASDAAARGEMKREEFQQMGEATDHGARVAAHMPGNFIDPDMICADPAFRKALAGVLDPAQAVILEDSFKDAVFQKVSLPVIALEQREKELKKGRQWMNAMRALEEASK
ncbi:MAG TPA: sigma-70 family RNA polymerase sigma factor [Haloferula sp.]